MRVFRRYAWVLRNVGAGLFVLGLLLQWRDQADGPLLAFIGFVLAVGAGVRNKIDQDLKVTALDGYEKAIDELDNYRGEAAESLRGNGWEELMVEQHRDQWCKVATEHYEALQSLRFIPLRGTWPRLWGNNLDEWRYVLEQLLRQDVPLHQR